MSAFCGVCGDRVPFGVPAPRIELKRFCPPEGSACHQMALRNERWKSDLDLSDIWEQLAQ